MVKTKYKTPFEAERRFSIRGTQVLESEGGLFVQAVNLLNILNKNDTISRFI